MDNQTQPPQKQQVTLDANSVKNVVRHITLIPAIGLIFIATLFIVFGGLDAKNVFSRDRTATTQGKVHDIRTTFPADETRTSPACEFSYTFTVNSQEYIGNSGSVSSASNCSLKSGAAVTVHYNPSDPFDNGLDNSKGTIGLGFFLVGVAFMILGVFIARRARNTMDDEATSAQIALIENGLQDLGQYWQPRKMTRAEADQVLEDIQTRLNAQRIKNRTGTE